MSSGRSTKQAGAGGPVQTTRSLLRRGVHKSPGAAACEKPSNFGPIAPRPGPFTNQMFLRALVAPVGVRDKGSGAQLCMPARATSAKAKHNTKR